ncbi:hypothetical protein RclHR1_01090011 [Rhizophagus clarus]|uniref:OTU domain-containing protein 6B n=1 Tax=Rhizophagus clarus TaxID=94130 RepID=A0A2Z6Q7E6_9GLOM|nr:hypothetical protein RclHR1_01090011 [Rhizophagus clarus]GET04267.1 OTU domain-containing protein 6B [Rhizophagus clarus]
MTTEEIKPEPDNAPITETFEELTLRHKKELKELTAKITALKKTATKGDKKRKKEVQNDIAKLETEFRKRQEEEVRQLQKQSPGKIESSGKTIKEEMKNNGDEDNDDDNEDIADKLLARMEAKRVEEEEKAALKASKATNIEVPKSKKPNRHKIRQERKAAKMVESQREAEDEASNQINMKEIENKKITEKIITMDLAIKEIAPDGHCLYNAISDQLQIRHNIVIGYKELRRKAAAYMREHSDEFIPFLPATQSGEMCSPEQFSKYCDDLENTAVWGGELEILAISKSLKLPVHVVQMSSPLLKISDDIFPNTKPIIISFHQYMYGLGSHYNSLRNNNSED